MVVDVHIVQKKKKKARRLDEIREIMNSYGYVLLSKKYINNSSLLKVMCPHGHVFNISAANFKRGRRCSHCYRYKKLTYGFVYDFFKKENYTLLSDCYESANKKLKVMCPQGHTFKISYSKFYTGRRCSVCSSSSGEQKIFNILELRNIKQSKQYCFKDCRLTNPLPFDFYLPDYNCCIEFDGEQHFKVDCFENSNIVNLMNIKYRDNIKNQYCKDNNIPLIRIPYWDFNNIENILMNEINKLK